MTKRTLIIAHYCPQTETSLPDISEITKSIDFTTEPQAEESSKEEEDDFEIVPADSCDDGEWVEISVMGVPEVRKLPFWKTSSSFWHLKKEETEVSELVETTTDDLGTSYSIYDVMQSDGPTSYETDFVESSAEGETAATGTTSPIELEEGSGASEAPEFSTRCQSGDEKRQFDDDDVSSSPSEQGSDATEPSSSTVGFSEGTTLLIGSTTASGTTEDSSEASTTPTATESTEEDFSSTSVSGQTETTTEMGSSTLGSSSGKYVIGVFFKHPVSWAR